MIGGAKPGNDDDDGESRQDQHQQPSPWGKLYKKNQLNSENIQKKLKCNVKKTEGLVLAI